MRGLLLVLTVCLLEKFGPLAGVAQQVELAQGLVVEIADGDAVQHLEHEDAGVGLFARLDGPLEVGFQLLAQQGGGFGRMLGKGRLIAQGVGGAACVAVREVGGALLDLFGAGQHAAEQIAAVGAGFVKGHRIFLLQIPVIISSYQGAGDAAVFVRLPGLQGNAVGGPVRCRQHNILRELPPLGNAGQQALDGVLLELFVHLGAVGSRHNVSRRGRAFKSQRSPFFLSVFPEGRGSEKPYQQIHLVIIRWNAAFFYKFL